MEFALYFRIIGTGIKMKQVFSNFAQKCRFNLTKCAGIVGFLGILSGGAAAQNIFWYSNPAAKVQNHAYFPTKNCINMGGGLEAPVEGEWGYRFDPRDFGEIRSAGFDTVRIPIKWSAHTSNGPKYTIDPVFLERVDRIIDWGLAQNLNVIINVHHFDELYENPDANEAKLYAIWAQLSYHYANAPIKLMFEVINEPKDNFSGARVNNVLANTLNIVRRHNPSRTVILTGDKWGDVQGMDNLRLPNDPYIVATVHNYYPFEFTHQGAEWMGADAPPKNRKWPMDGDYQKMNETIGKIYAWRQRLGVPVLMGEYGTDTAVPQDWRVSWAYDSSAAYKGAQIPTCYFNFSAGFGIFDSKTRKWNQPILRALQENFQR